MGCGNSTLPLLDYSKFENEKKLYKIRNDELELLGQDVLDDCIKKGNGTPEGINQIFDEINSIKKGIRKLKESEMKKAIQEVFVQQALINEKMIEEYDIQNKIKEKLSNYYKRLIQMYTQNIIDNIFKILFVAYPNKQNGFYLNANPNNLLEQDLEEAFYTNLKYNKTFKVQCISLNIDNSQINDINHLNKLAEIIMCNEKLKTLIIILNEDIPAGTNIKYLNNIFCSIENHCSLTALIFISKSSENKLTLTPEIENKILTLLDKRKSNKIQILNAFIMGKFLTSLDFLKKLTEVIPNSSVLKVFGYIINDYDPQISNVGITDDFVLRGIGRNNVLNAALIGGFKINENKVNEYKQLEKVTSNNIKIFQCVKDLEIDC